MIQLRVALLQSHLPMSECDGLAKHVNWLIKCHYYNSWTYLLSGDGARALMIFRRGPKSPNQK